MDFDEVAMSIVKRVLCVLAACLMFNADSLADSFSISEFGIDSMGLTLPDGVTPLTGNGIRIGQIEPGRPGVVGTDSAANTNTSVVPNLVVLQDGDPIVADGDPNSVHATEVASVIISTDTFDSNSDFRSPRGMAPGVLLQSSAYITEGVDGYEEVLLSIQYIANRNGSNVPVINHSWGKPRALDFTLDGQTLLSNGLDWIARKHDVLNVVAGNEGFMELPIPTDHYNGITVALSTRADDSVYRKVDSFNNFDPNLDAEGPRTSIDILAPGDDIEVATHGDTEFVVNGTSFAAPHVAGTAALLHEYGEFQANAGFGNWSGGVFRQHEAMKAVLMNSADKIKDDGSGKFLGMTRTVLKEGENNTDDWRDSAAFTDETIPLDEQMGTGHLNAARAFTQWTESPARGSSNTIVQNNIGWGFGRSRNDGEINRYIMGEIEAGAFISITLAWDRIVNIDPDVEEYFDGATFFPTFNFPNTFTNFDLHLLPRGSNSIDDAVWSSIASDSTVEHIFHEIETTGEYEFWVYQNGDVTVPNDATDPFSYRQRFGVAWWFDDELELVGDFDDDGDVDGADLMQWEGDFGLNGDSDADNDGDSDGADFLAWQRNFGTSSLSAATVPEPTCVMLLVLGLPILLGQRSSRHQY